MKALVFDDEPGVLALLSELLRRRGYEVACFSDPAFCPLTEQETCPHPVGQPCADIIITDLRMLKINGLDFAEHQRKKHCKCQHFALISGFWTDTDLNRAKKLGVKILKKPFYPKDIYAWLDEVEKAHPAAQSSPKSSPPTP
jgi:CheY-like chemotaxis protein